MPKSEAALVPAARRKLTASVSGQGKRKLGGDLRLDDEAGELASGSRKVANANAASSCWLAMVTK